MKSEAVAGVATLRGLGVRVSKNMKVDGCPELDKYINREHGKGCETEV